MFQCRNSEFIESYLWSSKSLHFGGTISGSGSGLTILSSLQQTSPLSSLANLGFRSKEDSCSISIFSQYPTGSSGSLKGLPFLISELAHSVGSTQLEVNSKYLRV